MKVLLLLVMWVIVLQFPFASIATQNIFHRERLIIMGSLFVVGIKCGPLPCPPYDNNRKLNCVVCSK